jgi:HlyD family secretion protein
MTVQPAVATPAEAPQVPSEQSNGQSANGSTGHATNGTAPHSPSRIPRAQRWTTRIKVLILAGVLVAVASTGSGTWYYFSSRRAARTDLVLYTAQKQKLLLTIVERGALESAENADIVCRVKAGTKNSTVATTLKSVVDDGTRVKKGDLVVELDDSGLIEQVKTEKIALDKAESDWKQSIENVKIVQSQNETDIKTAEVALELAIIDLEKYQKGDYEQSKKTLLGQIKTAESDLEQARDRAAWSKRMVQKGYQTQSQAQADQSKMESCELNLANYQEQLRVLDEPSYGMFKRTTTQLANAVAEAKRLLVRVQSQSRAKESSAVTDCEAKKSVYEMERDRYRDYQEEVRKCKLYAPQDGLVVYYISEQSRFGAGSQNAIVAQGEPVREGQKLMRIPDLNKMLVNTKVHEAQVSRLRGEERDASGNLLYPGMPAHVRLDSYPDRVLRGHVKSVATVASQQDFFSADVKVYQTMVAIDETIEGMKPGMSAEVTILVDTSDQPTLVVPTEAILGSVATGNKRQCFVMTPDGLEERDIVVGLTNEKMAEIRSGLKEGDQVVLNPKGLVAERSKARSPGEEDQKDNAPAWEGSRPVPKPPEVKSKEGKGGDKKGRGGNAKKGSAEDRQRMEDEFRKASPEERKAKLEQIPEEYRDRVKQGLKSKGIDIPD